MFNSVIAFQKHHGKQERGHREDPVASQRRPLRTQGLQRSKRDAFQRRLETHRGDTGHRACPASQRRLGQQTAVRSGGETPADARLQGSLRGAALGLAGGRGRDLQSPPFPSKFRTVGTKRLELEKALGGGG